MTANRVPTIEVKLGEHSIDFIQGESYVRWLLERNDEVVVNTIHGPMIFASLPNGKLQASTNPQIIRAFTQVYPASHFAMYGRQIK